MRGRVRRSVLFSVCGLPLLVLSACGGGGGPAAGPSTASASRSGPAAAGRASNGGSSGSAASAGHTSGTGHTPTAAVGLVKSLDALDFVSPQRGFAAGSGAILATRDGGRSWSRQYRGRLRIRALDFSGPRHGWAVASGALLRTSDGGGVWRRAAEPPQPLSAVAFTSATTGFGVAGSSLYRTVDAAKTWTRAKVPGPVQAVCFGGARRGWAAGGTALYRTVDGGAAWSLADRLQVTVPAGARWQLACAGPAHVWGAIVLGAAMSQESYVAVESSDGGATWHMPLAREAVGRMSGIAPYLGAFGLASGGGSVWFTGLCPACGMGSASVAVSTDGGRSWARHAIAGLHVVPTAVATGAAGQAWIAVTQGGGGRVLTTTNGGRSWTQQYPAAVTPALGIDMLSRSLGYGLGTLGDAARVLRTTDGGRRWTQVGTLPGAPASGGLGGAAPLPAMPLSFWDARGGYAVTPGGALWRTSDGGRSWTPVSAGLRSVGSVAFVGDGRYGCAGSPLLGHLRGTTDGGRTWVAVRGGSRGGWTGALACALRLQGAPAWKGLLAGAGAVPPAGPAPALLVAATGTPGYGWIWNGGTLRRTVDGGRTWTALPQKTASRGFGVQGLSFADAAHGWLITPGGRLLTTSDGGLHWRPLTPAATGHG